VEDSKLECIRLEGANQAAEIVHIDERREDRQSFYSVPIGDSIMIGFDVADERRREGQVLEARPLCKRVKVPDPIFGFPNDIGRGWVDTVTKLARGRRTW